MSPGKGSRKKQAKRKAAALRNLPAGTVIEMEKQPEGHWIGRITVGDCTMNAKANGITGMGATLAHKFVQARSRAKKARKLRERLSKLSRSQIEALLEGVAIACYDHEDTATLQEALAVNIEDGTIRYCEVPVSV